MSMASIVGNCADKSSTRLFKLRTRAWNRADIRLCSASSSESNSSALSGGALRPLPPGQRSRDAGVSASTSVSFSVSSLEPSCAATDGVRAWVAASTKTSSEGFFLVAFAGVDGPATACDDLGFDDLFVRGLCVRVATMLGAPTSAVCTNLHFIS